MGEATPQERREKAAKKIIADLVAEVERVYKKGMTREEFQKTMLSGMEITEAPEWIRTLVGELDELDIC